jgi:hypothetical protein
MKVFASGFPQQNEALGVYGLGVRQVPCVRESAGEFLQGGVG